MNVEFVFVDHSPRRFNRFELYPYHASCSYVLGVRTISPANDAFLQVDNTFFRVHSYLLSQTRFRQIS